MTVNQLTWEPESTISPIELEKFAQLLTNDKGNVSILKNGTFLFVNKSDDDEKFAKELTEDFKKLYNFEVLPVDVGGYLVIFHDAVSVFVSDEEFTSRIDEISSRVNDLCFPNEKITMPANAPDHHALVGIYARGKLHRDADHFQFIKRI